MTGKLSLREELEGALDSISGAWAPSAMQESIDMLLEEGWVDERPELGDFLFFPVHFDLLSGKTVQMMVPIKYTTSGGELVGRERVLDVLVRNAEIVQRSKEYDLLILDLNQDGDWTPVLMSREGTKYD